MRAATIVLSLLTVTAVGGLALGCGGDSFVDAASDAGGASDGALGDSGRADGDASMVSDAADDEPGADADASIDGDVAADADGSIGADVGADAPTSPDADGSTDADAACAPETIDYAATRDEADAVDRAVAAFEAAHPDVKVTVSGATRSVEAIDGEVPLALDVSISDPCDRAIAALDAFFADNASLLRLPAGMKRKACTYDSLTDAEIVRLDGGTYFDGRPLVGRPTELLVHVRRSGAIKYWRGTYEAALDRTAITPCLDAIGAASAAVGAILHYTRFEHCVVKGPGEIALTSHDDYVPLEAGVLIDDDGRMHFVRRVDGFLGRARVSPETGNSDLYCCAEGTTDECVGKTLAIDERTGEVLGEYPRCHTC